jgi:ABC-2 type transport system permease protein
MRIIYAIAKKELAVYLTTPWAWVVSSLLALASAAYFLLTLIYFKQVQDQVRSTPGGWPQAPAEYQAFRNLTDGVIVNLWGFALSLILFATPFLTMRLFAEERKNKTFELLMTTPIRASEIVGGKFLGAMGILVCSMGSFLIFPIILSVIGTSESGSALEWSTVLLGFFAIFLLGAANCAIGLFVSSLTESQMVAAVVSLVISIIFLLIGMVSSGLEEPWRSIVSYVAFDRQLANLLRGVFDLKPVVYFSSIAALFLMLTHRSIEARRWI